jgi:type IX secretion system PorP/SprF family membrane protein
MIKFIKKEDMISFKNIAKILLLFVLFSIDANAQQDEQSSLYMFNPLHYNPAYAGTRGDLSVTAIARYQWVGINGAPKSQFLSMNSPLKVKNMALGCNLSNDAIGVKNRTSFYGAYAYTLNFNKGRRLNLGVSTGGEQFTVNYNKLIANDPTETEYLSSFSQMKFNAGIGLYYHTEKFFAGLSVPRLFQSSLKNNAVVLSNSYTKRHYFLSLGYVFKMNSVIDLKTSILVKAVENAPLTADINANLFFYKKIWVGAMYRFNESVGVNLAYQIKESLMFGYAFDFPINGLSRINNMGSHEIMLNYSFNKKKAFGSPRYF